MGLLDIENDLLNIQEDMPFEISAVLRVEEWQVLIIQLSIQLPQYFTYLLMF